MAQRVRAAPRDTGAAPFIEPTKGTTPATSPARPSRTLASDGQPEQHVRPGSHGVGQRLIEKLLTDEPQQQGGRRPSKPPPEDPPAP